MRIQFVKGTTSTLEFYPPEDRLPDGSVSLTIYSSGQSELEGVWPATLIPDTTSTTISVAAQRGDTSLTVTSTAGFVIGRRYLVFNELGQVVPVWLQGLDATTLVIDMPLPWSISVDASSIVRGYRVTQSLSASQNGTRQLNYRAVFSYDLDGITKYHSVMYDVVRQQYGFSLSEHYLESFWPSFSEYTSEDWRRLADSVIYEVIFNELLALGYQPDYIRDADKLKPWAAYLLLEAIQVDQLSIRRGDPSAKEHWSREAARAKDRLLHNPTLWYDDSDDFSGGSMIGKDAGASSFADGGDWTLVRQSGTTRYSTTDSGLPVGYDPVG